jgi:hypothetical protein
MDHLGQIPDVIGPYWTLMDVIWTIDFLGLMGFPSVGKGTARAGKGRKGPKGIDNRKERRERKEQQGAVGCREDLNHE